LRWRAARPSVHPSSGLDAAGRPPAECADAGQLRAIRRRILVAQALYAIGAALAFVDTRLSIAWIVLVQLNFATGPRLPLLRHI
jgi:hypothetical protein